MLGAVRNEDAQRGQRSRRRTCRRSIKHVTTSFVRHRARVLLAPCPPTLYTGPHRSRKPSEKEDNPDWIPRVSIRWKIKLPPPNGPPSLWEPESNGYEINHARMNLVHHTAAYVTYLKNSILRGGGVRLS